MGAEECQPQRVLGIATSLDEADEMAAQRHSRAAGGKKASAKTRVRSEGFARWTRDRKPAASEEGIDGAAAAAVPGVVHCWDRTGDSCSASRRAQTDAAESETGRCMAERPS